MLQQSERPAASTLLIIIAQSARFLIQSAARHGYRVRAADCFADSDSVQHCERFIRLEPITTVSPQQLHETIELLAEGQTAYLIIGTGIEYLYPALTDLPEHIHSTANSAEVCSQVCQPMPWFTLLDSLQLPHPEVTYQPQSTGQWLLKDAAGWGGSHISAEQSISDKSHYLQRHVHGISYSALFVIDAQYQPRLLMFNRQICVDADNGDFRLQTLYNHPELATHQQQAVMDAIMQIQQRLNLRGLNSLDFMVSDTGQLLLLELNPRPSASCQLLPETVDWLHWQIAAPQNLPDIKMSYRLLYHFFAEQMLTIPHDLNWPADFCDLPAPGTIHAEGDPVCSLCIEAPDTIQRFERLEQQCEFFRKKVALRLKNLT
ncbi:ATP-grasp domain-containing protein [Methylophaga lonarensis MPL]|uniref:ATP-grasp domain-containing protein n=1 Tax=Methylophaga lonarensis MPL TaxID=1286106 RepID=M7NV68_9GAMM|nr:ATP-grasp domain-containing protein [Methylophaga lonarensis]EMR12658.1 ATP-grasp domain-containing protein [Methylophaga lonarensis MPL]